MFDLCRSVEWNSFEPFAGLYLRLALAEGRIDDAARLLGYADAARQRAWSTQTTTPSQEDARARLSAMQPAQRLAQLCAEGERSAEEQVCRWVLAAPTDARGGSAAGELS